MSVTTVNGATCPAGPQPGQAGVRAYRDSDLAATAADGVEAAREADGVRETLQQSIGLVNAILTVVVAGAAAYAGLNVMSNIGQTMALGENDTFYTASQNLQDGVASFFSQMPTVFVVIALVLIIGYLMLLRG